MLKASQDLSLSPEPLVEVGAARGLLHDLDRDLLLELPVRPLGQVDGSHPAEAERLEQPVRTQDLARLGQGRSEQCVAGPVELSLAPLACANQRHDSLEKLAIVAAGLLEEPLAFLGGALESLLQQTVDFVPTIRGGFAGAGHATFADSCSWSGLTGPAWAVPRWGRRADVTV